ncbi:MAG: N-6 DNA methylase [Armatimonadetes bacterium]|nr:N-6 DNA methylase [Armatimonadota bacterium]
MLDTDTKRRIDTARDILVGKVPDPKSQVEQITIALIYKFMDDMDAQSEEYGGRRTFFAGEFERYGWPKLMRAGLGGHDTLNLYAEAIAKMPENPGIPLLFREIFKNAYLPYRDPATLRAFLKTIDEFTYDHSERLGDAFEYLLSVLGSQGDAGQFRTPRHIIDFMVEVVDPKKDETVLDPACGTAGFLISAYKHIRKAHSGEGAVPLTPDENGALARNFTGYDISPDMVRISLVNLYLHGFVDPHIHEYDTLTSQERWNEVADIILANPPFMSPKGGIRPHDRFSVQSKRSEVLFVDYMAEHLTARGRAAIIVPEGIIFQSQGAYTRLRKMLVEEYLVAVVSLPAGVFNPYSGVKTSILVLDKALARRADTIAFLKVENDGFGLGAQRREIEKNDLPTAAAELAEYLRRLREGEPVKETPTTLGHVVEKSRVAAGGDYNLSGERYREAATSGGVYPLVQLSEVCDVNPRDRIELGLPVGTEVSFLPMADLGTQSAVCTARQTRPIGELAASYTSFRDGDVLLAKVTPCFENGKAGIMQGLTHGCGFGSSEFYVLRASDRLERGWLYRCVTREAFRTAAVPQMTGTGGLQRVPRQFVETYRIPLPPLDVQRAIVAEIEGYQKVIDGARAVVENYRPHIVVDAAWPMVAIAAIADVQGGVQKTPSRQPKVSHRPYLTVRNVQRGCLDLSQVERFEVSDTELQRLRLRVGDILVVEGNGSRDQIGRTALFDICGEEWVHQNHIIRVRLDRQRAVPSFVEVFLNSDQGRHQMLSTAVTTSGLYMLSAGRVGSLEVPLPSLETQQSIVAEIEAEQALVAASRELIARFEKKIEGVLARVWGEGVP